MKSLLYFALTATVSLVATSELFAQQGTTVQLPAFRTQRLNTSAWVPDRGSAYLGGIHRSAMGQTSRSVPFLGNIPGLNRLFRNQAIGRESSTGSIRANVHIINLDELDEDVLAEAARRRALRGGVSTGGDVFGGRTAKPSVDSKVDQKAAFITRNIGRNFNQQSSNR